MQTATDARESGSLIEDAAESIRRRLGAEGAAAADFCTLFYAHVPKDDYADLAPETLALQALSAFKFAERRKGPAPSVRVFNPSLGDDGWRSGHTVVEITQDDMPFLVDSVVAELTRHGHTVHLVIHPVVNFTRTGERIQLHIRIPWCERKKIE